MKDAARPRRRRRGAAAPSTTQGHYVLDVDGDDVTLEPDDVEIRAEQHEELALAQDGRYAVALDLDARRRPPRRGHRPRAHPGRQRPAQDRTGFELADRIAVDLALDRSHRRRGRRGHRDWIRAEVLATGVRDATPGDCCERARTPTIDGEPCRSTCARLSASGELARRRRSNTSSKTAGAARKDRSGASSRPASRTRTPRAASSERGDTRRRRGTRLYGASLAERVDAASPAALCPAGAGRRHGSPPARRAVRAALILEHPRSSAGTRRRRCRSGARRADGRELRSRSRRHLAARAGSAAPARVRLLRSGRRRRRRRARVPRFGVGAGGGSTGGGGARRWRRRRRRRRRGHAGSRPGSRRTVDLVAPRASTYGLGDRRCSAEVCQIGCRRGA